MNRHLTKLRELAFAKEVCEADLSAASHATLEILNDVLKGRKVSGNVVCSVTGETLETAEVELLAGRRTMTASLVSLLRGPGRQMRIYDRTICDFYSSASQLLSLAKQNMAASQNPARNKILDTVFARQLAKTFEVREDAAFYEMLAWLVTNISKVTAILAESCVEPFVNKFGTETPYKCIDSRKRNQRSILKVTLKDVDDTPEMLQQYLKAGSKEIIDLEFVLELLSYGIQFGSEQDVQKVLSNVPEQYHIYFN